MTDQAPRPSLSLYKWVAQQLVGPFEPLLTQGLTATLQWMVLRGPLALRISAAIGLIGCVSMGWLLFTNVSTAEDLLYRALGTRMEDINQPNAGLQAALLAEFDQGIDSFQASAHLRQDFITVYTGIAKALQSPPNAAIPIVVKPQDGGRITERYFSEPSNPGTPANSFLFLPAFIMRGFDALSADSVGVFSDRELLQGLDQDRSLKWDIEHSRTAGADLCSLNNTMVFDPPSVYEPGTTWAGSTPVQSYLITSSGILRICEANQKSQEDYYAPRFKATTFFPERNYFVATVSSNRTLAAGLPLDQAFYIRRPYIDLGGNGIVISLCKEISLRRVSDSAVCMDFPVGENSPNLTAAPTAATITKLSKRIARLGGTPVKVHCEVRKPETAGQRVQWKCADEAGNRYADIESKATNDYKRDLSELFGKINTSYPAPKAKLRFTLPIASTGDSSGDLLSAQLDVAPVRTRSTREAIAFGVSLVWLMASVALLIGDYGLRLREQHVAFDEVGVVMSHAPVPYCRLDSTHHLIDSNPEFERMLDAAESLRGKDFRQYLTAGGRAKYEAETKKRINRESSEYVLEMQTATGRVLETTVFGAPVPEPDNPNGKKPQTFGIFIPLTNNVTVLSAVAARGDRQRDGTTGFPINTAGNSSRTGLAGGDSNLGTNPEITRDT